MAGKMAKILVSENMMEELGNGRERKWLVDDMLGGKLKNHISLEVIEKRKSCNIYLVP